MSNDSPLELAKAKVALRMSSVSSKMSIKELMVAVNETFVQLLAEAGEKERVTEMEADAESSLTFAALGLPEISGTPRKRQRWDEASDGASESDDDFVTKASKRKLAIARRKAALDGVGRTGSTSDPVCVVKQQPAKVRRARVRRLILDGVEEVDRVNPVSIKRILKDGGQFIAKTAVTKAGNVLVFANTEDDRDELLKLELPSGLKIRPTRGSAAAPRAAAMTLVVSGVHPSITDSELSNEIGQPCHRLKSSKLGGTDTWKVKIICGSAEDKQRLLKEGVHLGHQRHRAAEYITKPTVLQCFRCLSFGHIAKACTSERKCRHCAGTHESQKCDATAKTCANCGGAHSATDFVCPQYAAKLVEKEAKTVSYASAVKKGGDKVDCVRLACCIAASLVSCLNKHLDNKLKAAEVCSDVADSVARFFKTQVKAEYVHHIAFNQKAPSA